jgi:hypothetical protein
VDEIKEATQKMNIELEAAIIAGPNQNQEQL